MAPLFSIRIVLDTLSKQPSGAITGVIHLKLDEITFPESDWNDFVIVILGWWLRDIRSLIDEHSQSCICRFMDGPFQFEIEAAKPDAWVIRFVRRTRSRNEYLTERIAARQDIVDEMLATTKSVIDACLENEWDTVEISTLKENYASILQPKIA